MNYRTPGVYVEEISIFPPSIAQVDTAIPAFIGYTEKAQLIQPDDLLNVAQEVNSFTEFNLYFGFGPPVSYTSIEIDATNGVSKINSTGTYYLYDSMQLFYANGGGKCFVISVGPYSKPAAIQKADFNFWVDALRKKDDPTLILFPDAVVLPAADFHALQQSALVECGDINTRVDVNRFAILDLQEGTTDMDWKNGVDNFRNNIGINNLKYGAVYTPWLKATLTKTVNYRDLIETSVAGFPGKLVRSGILINIIDLANSYSATDKANIQAQLTALNNAIADALLIRNDLSAATKPVSNTEFNRLTDALNSATAIGSKSGALEAVFEYLYHFADLLQKYTDNTIVLSADLNTLAEKVITSVKPQYVKLIGHDKGAATATVTNFPLFSGTDHNGNTNIKWGDIFNPAAALPPPELTTIFVNPATVDQMTAAIPMLREIFDAVYVGLATLKTAADTNELTLQKALFDGFPTLNNIVTALKRASATIPPSGAIAGIYSRVDGNRGVWKAPANESLNSVSAVTVEIDDKKQESLNIHDTGKSINVIRKFTGRGIIVWGARTLAGNDNEWRYIPVRRFYNMVEESVKKACLQFVFEANDANTWVKVRSMIENYLNTLWRQGALAGAKPEQAYFVRIGLGTTMTFQDILEGKMIVKIGMAPVRPAEFIILEFSQRQQES